jgi:hypothetical protein
VRSAGDGVQCGYVAWAFDLGELVGDSRVFLLELFYV